MSLILSACGLWPASGATFGKEETLPKTKERERYREDKTGKYEQKKGAMGRKVRRSAGQEEHEKRKRAAIAKNT